MISHFEFTWGINKKEKKNFATVDDEIESLKNKIFKIDDTTYKFIDIRTTEKYPEYRAELQPKDGKPVYIKLCLSIEDSIEKMKTYII